MSLHWGGRGSGHKSRWPKGASNDVSQLLALLSGVSSALYIADPAYLWKDTAGTSPVTADGDSVARWDDASGNGHYATQGTGAAQPTYKTDGTLKWLSFDGGDYLVSNNTVDISGAAGATVCLGHRKIGTTAGSAFASVATGAIEIFSPGAPANSFGFRGKGTAAAADVSVTGYTSPVSVVITSTVRVSTDERFIRINGAANSDTATDLGSGGLPNATIGIGARTGGTQPITGYIYGLMVSNQISSTLTTTAETLMKRLTGVSF